MDQNSSYAILGRAAGDGALVREMEKHADEGLSPEDFAAMEKDVLDNPDRYPILHKLLTDPGPRCTKTPQCQGYEIACSHGGW